MANNKDSAANGRYTVKNALVNYYLLLMFTLFPLFFTQQYSNIRHDKYYLFLIFSMILAVVEFMMVISEDRGPALEQSKKWYRCLGSTDWAMLALLFVYSLSTVFSAYPMDSVTGNQGRNNGLLLMVAYTAVYFVITRQYKFYEYVFGALAAGSGVVFLLAIINYFYIDPLGMFTGYEQQYITDFSSTIGNKNLLSSFVCVCLPVVMMLFINTAVNKLRWLYYAVTVIGFSALLVADSDSGFLGFFVFLIIILIYYIRKPQKLSMFFFSVFSMLAGAKILRLFSLIMIDNSKGFTDIPRFFIYNSGISYALIVFFGLLALTFYLVYKRNPDIIFPKAVFIAAVCIVSLLACAVAYLFIKYTFLDTSTPLNEVMSYFRFNDKWGTHRGYMWRKSAEIFGGFGVKDKLLGCGPDTFYTAFSPYFSELYRLYGDGSTNCAHNEYLNYLVTTGILGLAAYLAVIGSFIVRAVKYAKVNPLAMVCCSGVICYCIQAVVNIAQPITTPLFIILLAIGEAVCRKAKESNRLTE